jgi:hypothetical protein
MPLHFQRFEILEERLLESSRIFADGNAGLRCVADDLVVHIGNIHHVPDGNAGETQKTAQHVDLQKRAEVADVAVVVNRGPAGVHPQCFAIGRREGLDLSGKSIEKVESHCWRVSAKYCVKQSPKGLSDCSNEKTGRFRPV